MIRITYVFYNIWSIYYLNLFSISWMLPRQFFVQECGQGGNIQTYRPYLLIYLCNAPISTAAVVCHWLRRRILIVNCKGRKIKNRGRFLSSILRAICSAHVNLDLFTITRYYFLKSTNYETSNYAIFPSLILHILSRIKIFYSTKVILIVSFRKFKRSGSYKQYQSLFWFNICKINAKLFS